MPATMATRRPPSRIRSNTSTLNPPANSSRPRSVLSKPGLSNAELSSRSEQFQPTASATTTVSASAKDPQQNDIGSNIKVVIRSRRRSEREIQENSPIIVTTDGRDQGITIETAALTSVLGVITLPPTRTYPFDVVFGPEADQSIVYQDVVHPMLEEVLKGYNCTLFAYGQTGTGKTYTMQGDLNLTPLGNPSSQAGMIPRVLFKLFSHLEASGIDYSVKISFIELYNEELRDLLAPELAAPAGLAQPMSFGGAPKEPQSGLKVFDDSNKKGVFIQGLEEAPVKDFRDALALLSKGSQRRQIAATKFNDHSSRSHSIFSITVHSKEVSNLGDDLLKVGKLNLVDLAGSENIGRSGAENKRAREAGMINQSLLTLGRVINALVDNASHVPYRESKLTRLLQDSLGGRTKTCIIATISPARSNMEETLSTLDYAMRAKSIRNKPEVNQRMTRNALLKEYVAEIDRLKSDVLAAREKNGIYFSEETWDQINAEHELRQTEVEEAKKHIEVVESQMRTVREEFEQSMALLLKTDNELGETKGQLKRKEAELVEREEELQDVKSALEEEKIIAEAHALTEQKLNEVALSLRHVVQESTADVEGLFKKLERKTRLFNSNVKTVSGQTKFLDAEARTLLSTLQEFVAVSNLHIAGTVEHANNFHKKRSDALGLQLSSLNTAITSIQARLQAVQAKDNVADEQLALVKTAIDEMQEQVKIGFIEWSLQIASGFETLCNEIEKNGSASCSIIEDAFKTILAILGTAIGDTRTFLNKEREAEREKGILAKQLAEDEIERLRRQNTLLLRLMESEQEKAKRMREELVQRVSSMLVEFSEERDNSLRQAVQGLTTANTEAMGVFRATTDKHVKLGEASTERGQVLSNALGIVDEKGNQAVASGLKGVSAANDAFKIGLVQARDYTSMSIKEYSSKFTKDMHVSGASCSKALERADRAKRMRIEQTEGLVNDTLKNYRAIQSDLESQSQSAHEFREGLVSQNGSFRTQIQEFSSTAKSHVSSIRKHAQILQEQGAREDEPSGSTPRKRAWHFANGWETTSSREVLLQNFRRENAPAKECPPNNTSDPVEADLPEDTLPIEMTTTTPPYESQVTEVEVLDAAEVVFLDNLSENSDVSAPYVPQPIPPPRIKRSTSTLRETKAIPALRTLTERSTNIMPPRARRKNIS